MQSLSDRLSVKRFVVLFGIVTVVAILVVSSTSTTAFGAYNDAWDGTSNLRSLARDTKTEGAIAQNTSAYNKTTPQDTIAFALAPAETYDRRDAARIEQFVRRGGTLLVGNERATSSNSLLSSIGASTRVNGTLLRDERVYYRSPNAPFVRNVSQHRLVANVSSLTLNYGSALEPGSASVLARTSGYAYLDANGNHWPDSGETLSKYPVVTVEQLGRGRVIVVSDASLFINDMLERSGNEQFARSLLARHDRVLFDYSHTTTLPRLVQIVFLIRTAPVLQLLFGGLGILAIVLVQYPKPFLATVSRLFGDEPRPGWGTLTRNEESTVAPSSPVGDDDLVGYLQSKYPDMDERRLRRIVSLRHDSTHPAESDK